MTDNADSQKIFHVGLLLPTAIESHEQAWLYGDSEASAFFLNVLSSVQKYAEERSLSNIPHLCRNISDKWLKVSFNRRHDDWSQILDILNHQCGLNAGERLKLGFLLTKLPRPVLPPDEGIEFKLSQTDDLLFKVKKELAKVATSGDSFTWRQVVEVTAKVAPVLFHPDAGDTEIRKMRSRIYSFFLRMTRLLRCSRSSAFSGLNDPMPACVFSSRQALARAIMLKSPVGEDLSDLVWTIAEEVQELPAPASTWFSLGLHASLLRSCPQFIPSSMHLHPLLLATHAHAFYPVVTLGEEDARKILHLMRDEIERLSMTGEEKRLISEGPQDFSLMPLMRWAGELVSAIERSLALK